MFGMPVRAKKGQAEEGADLLIELLLVAAGIAIVVFIIVIYGPKFISSFK